MWLSFYIHPCPRQYQPTKPMHIIAIGVKSPITNDLAKLSPLTSLIHSQVRTIRTYLSSSCDSLLAHLSPLLHTRVACASAIWALRPRLNCASERAITIQADPIGPGRSSNGRGGATVMSSLSHSLSPHFYTAAHSLARALHGCSPAISLYARGERERDLIRPLYARIDQDE